MKRLGLMAAAAALTASSAFAAEGIEINKFLTLGGFIDLGYVSTSVDSGFKGAAPIAKQDMATFAMQQAELDLSLNISEGLSGRIDVSGGTEASGVQSLPGGANIDDLNIEQARIDLKVNSWGLAFGKWDSYIGLEAFEPTEVYQDSLSLTNELIPNTQTGINFNYKADMFSFDLGVVNGLMTENPDRNDEIGFQAHIGVTPWDAWGFNLSYGTAEETAGAVTSGKVAAGAKADNTLIAIDAQYQNYGFTVGLEYASLNIDGVTAAADLENTAYELMVNYKFTEQFSLTGRYSQDEGKTGGKLSEITLAPIFAVTPNWTVMAEYRSESGSKDYTGTATGIQGAYGGGNTDASAIALKTILKF